MTYRITFLPMDRTVEVDPDALDQPRDGRRGSLLQVALENGLDIDHACGGIAACSTCHVIVREGGASIPDAEDDEEDMLDSAPGLTLDSRLACQAVPSGEKDLVVEVPEWNRNQVKEADHG